VISKVYDLIVPDLVEGKLKFIVLSKNELMHRVVNFSLNRKFGAYFKTVKQKLSRLQQPCPVLTTLFSCPRKWNITVTKLKQNSFISALFQMHAHVKRKPNKTTETTLKCFGNVSCSLAYFTYVQQNGNISDFSRPPTKLYT